MSCGEVRALTTRCACHSVGIMSHNAMHASGKSLFTIYWDYTWMYVDTGMSDATYRIVLELL